MNKKKMIGSLFFLMILGFSHNVFAHFGMLIPSDTMIMQEDTKRIMLNISFSHPFEGKGMEMAKPEKFGVWIKGQKYDLLNKLKLTKIMDHGAWKADYRIKRPGAYIFYMEPQPYWEPAEDCFIIHYTKTVITAFGDDEGWDNEIGLLTEIVPISKPFGLYKGNLFQGLVKLNGKPVPFAEVEVEYYNRSKKAKAPTDYMVTQTIKADKNGLFSYAVPRSGWWGFAALSLSDKKIKFKSDEKDCELGAVLWVKFHDWQEGE